jgi:hypothetical protein
VSTQKADPGSAAGAIEAPARGPGRPRSAEAHERILWAALTEVQESGYRALTIEAVAARAKVGKATIYRRWPSKRELIQAAIPLIRPPDAPEDQGSLDADLGAWITEARTRVQAADMPLVLARLVAEAVDDRDLHAFVVTNLIAAIRGALGTMLRRGVERGELSADLDAELAVDMLHGTLVYRMLITRGDAQRASTAVPQVLGVLTRAFPGKG